MTPAHRNLNGSQAMMPRQIQQLGIEPEALDGLLLEDDPAAVPPERFEPALRIHKRQPQDDSYNFVEYDSGEFAEERFMHANQAAVGGPGANSHIVNLQSLDELVGL